MLTVVDNAKVARQPDSRMGIGAAITQGTAAERLSRALHRHVGRGRDWTIERLAREAEVSTSHIEKAMAAEHTFGLASLLRVMAALPPSFTNDVVELARLTGARRLNGQAQSAAFVLADLCRQSSELADDLSDGRLDHVEKAQLRRSLPGLIHRLQEFQAQLGAE